MQIIIRLAGREDLPDILDIYRELEADEGTVLTTDEANNIFDRIATYPNYRIYVAQADNKIVGTFALAVMDNLAHMGAPSGLIEDVVVRSDCQGKGIGKQMMRFALACCRENGCYKVALSSNKKRTSAHQFYESLGFQKHGYSFTIEPE